MNCASQALFSTPDSNVDYLDRLQRYSALYRILLATPYSTRLVYKQWYRINLKLVNELDLPLTREQKDDCWLELGCVLLVEHNKTIVPCTESLVECRPLQHDAWDSTATSEIAGFQNDSIGDFEFMVSVKDEGYTSSSATNARYYIQIYPKTQKKPSVQAFPLMIGPISIVEPSAQLNTATPLDYHIASQNEWKESNTSNAIFHGYQLQNSSFLIIREDWDLGTPGKMWDSALVLSQMITDNIRQNPDYFRGNRLIDLSAGTGCLGLLVAALYKNIYVDHQQHMPSVTLTDLPEALDLIYQNRCYNHLEYYSNIKPLEWGNHQDVQDLLSEGPIHTVIASDVLYRPSTFPSLVQTLVWLSDENKGTIDIFMGYKRRGLDLCDERKFFDLCLENFDIITLSASSIFAKQRSIKRDKLEGWVLNNGGPDGVYKDTGVNIYQLVRKRKPNLLKSN